MKHAALAAVAVALCVTALVGTVFSVRAARAYALYYRAKFGAAREDPKAVLELAERSYRLHRWNYYLCVLAGETAYRARTEGGTFDDDGRLSAARFWCRRGLDLNPYKRALRLLEVRLAADTSGADEAVGLWERYLDWHFWDPYNHRVMAELHAEAGDYDKAIARLKWIENSPRHREAARQSINEAWRREMQPPPPARAHRPR